MSMLSNVQTYDIKNYENVKSFFEHIGLYLGLVAYTAAGAKVIGTLPQFSFTYIRISCLQCMGTGKRFVASASSWHLATSEEVDPICCAKQRLIKSLRKGFHFSYSLGKLLSMSFLVELVSASLPVPHTNNSAY